MRPRLLLLAALVLVALVLPACIPTPPPTWPGVVVAPSGVGFKVDVDYAGIGPVTLTAGTGWDVLKTKVASSTVKAPVAPHHWRVVVTGLRAGTDYGLRLDAP